MTSNEHYELLEDARLSLMQAQDELTEAHALSPRDPKIWEIIQTIGLFEEYLDRQVRPEMY